jgi:RNA polymerase sigma factor (sigma-70 family)
MDGATARNLRPLQPVPTLAFAAFYEREIVGQVRHATLLLGSREAAHDAVHDAFVAVYERWDELDDPGPYLQRAVINRCRGLLRRSAVARRLHPSRRADVPAEDRDLYDALAKLPFNHRAAVVLRYFLQLTEVEIAERLQCRPGSVGPWIRRGLDRLARDLGLPEGARR